MGLFWLGASPPSLPGSIREAVGSPQGAARASPLVRQPRRRSNAPPAPPMAGRGYSRRQLLANAAIAASRVRLELVGKSIQSELGLLLGLMPHSVFRNQV